jgi:hypothetical protein
MRGGYSIRISFCAVLILVFLANFSAANIYLDEDFEGATAFVDRNWPVQNTTATATVPLVQGLNLRARSNGELTPKVQIGTRQGAIVSTRAYKGTRSYRLAPDSALAVTPGQFPSRGKGPRLCQFALSVDSAAAALPAGTEAGRFEINYSLDSASSLVPDLTIALELVADGAGGVDLLCANNGAPLATLSGGASDWVLVTLIANLNVSDSDNADVVSQWRAYDPLTDTYKGPDFTLPTGIHIYAKKNDRLGKTTLSRADALTAAWGNNNAHANTAEIGWRFAAGSGAALYLDNLYWDCYEHSS